MDVNHQPYKAVIFDFDDTLVKSHKAKRIEKENILYVGDSVDDVQAAHAAHIGFIGVATGIHEKQILVDAGAQIVLPHIRELPDYIL